MYAKNYVDPTTMKEASMQSIVFNVLNLKMPKALMMRMTVIRNQ